MKSFPRILLLLLAAITVTGALRAQTPQKVNGADDRFKADILVVVAHPDDEGFFTPYLAKAIYDMHKRVAVVFSTRGESASINHYSREHGPAMANERELEAREACASLSIKNVWFLDGKDTASQNLLDSLANWGHGANLEKMVGLIRLTRPEVILTHFPGVFIGENHGDHQATGVLVAEAFELAADATVFPSQLAGPAQQHEGYLSNLRPWQAKKIYFGSDANDQKQFDGSGPTYSVREVSPSQKKPYSVLAIRSAIAHRTQSEEDFDHLSKLSDAELEKMMNDPNTGWWSEPSTLIFGKSVVGGKSTDDVFAHIDEWPSNNTVSRPPSAGAETAAEKLPRVELGGPWRFYSTFYPAHGLNHLRIAKVPEIGVKAGTTLVIPLVIFHNASKTLPLNITVKAPEGWKTTYGSGQFLLPAEDSTSLPVHIETPNLSGEELKKTVAQEVTVLAEADGKPVGEVKLRVQLGASALPQ